MAYLVLWRSLICEVVGSNNRSILQLGKQAESYKGMICSPPCLSLKQVEQQQGPLVQRPPDPRKRPRPAQALPNRTGKEQTRNK